jgi:hypothetical protein
MPPQDEVAMVDRERRTELCELARHLLSNQITNFEYDDKVMLSQKPVLTDTDDMGVRMVGVATWSLYDDFHEHRFNGHHELTREQRREVLRWLLFLQTDLEYEWPDRRPIPLEFFGLAALVLACLITGLSAIPVACLVLGILAALDAVFILKAAAADARWSKLHDPFHEEPFIWPFQRRRDYEEALRHPRLLCGKQT